MEININSIAKMATQEIVMRLDTEIDESYLESCIINAITESIRIDNKVSSKDYPI